MAQWTIPAVTTPPPWPLTTIRAQLPNRKVRRTIIRTPATSHTSRPTVLLYLKDGTTYAASDYWLQDGQLHYIVNYGGESTLDMDELDLQRTVNENARRGVNFSLHPNPSTVNPQPSSNGSPAAGSSTDQTNHYRAPQYGNGNNNGATPATAPSPAPAPQTPQTQTASQTL